MEKLTTWLWFDTEAEEAAQFYVDLPGLSGHRHLALR